MFEKSRFWAIFSKILILFEIFQKYRCSPKFSKNLTFSPNLQKQYRHFPKYRPKSRFFFLQISTWTEIFRKFRTTSGFSKISSKIKIFENFGPKSWFPNIWTHIEILANFDQDRDFGKFRPKWGIFEKISTKIETFRKLSPKSKFIENCDQNRDFTKTMTKMRFFNNFDKNWDFSKFFL